MRGAAAAEFQQYLDLTTIITLNSCGNCEAFLGVYRRHRFTFIKYVLAYFQPRKYLARKQKKITEIKGAQNLILFENTQQKVRVVAGTTQYSHTLTRDRLGPPAHGYYYYRPCNSARPSLFVFP